MSQEYPWMHHPDLTEERLQHLANLIVKVRHDALDIFDEIGGDTHWSHGCRAYARTCSRICREAELLSWLDIVDPNLMFIFTIGDVPVRFYKGTPDDSNKRTMERSFSELNQLSFAYQMQETPSLVWRFAVEVDHDGEVSQITFFGSGYDGSIVCRWLAGIHSFESDFDSDVVPVMDGVDLEAPVVTKKYSGE